MRDIADQLAVLLSFTESFPSVDSLNRRRMSYGAVQLANFVVVLGFQHIIEASLLEIFTSPDSAEVRRCPLKESSGSASSRKHQNDI